jgi:two-component system OmpR family response regulator
LIQPNGHILVAEDDPGVRRLLRTVLEDDGYKVSEARTAQHVRQALATREISLITLDLGLGGDDGLAVARDIRRTSDAAIIMVTAKASDVDRIVGLEVGADDYIVKPFNVREVVARVRAVLRRTSCVNSACDSQRLAFDGFVFDVAGRSLMRTDGALVDLTSREHALLECFVRRPRRAITRDALLELVDGGSCDALDRAVDTLVSRLRRKVEADPANPALIKTVRGVGYLFAAQVTALSAADQRARR